MTLFFDSPDVAGEIFVKRVIGLPGETVEIRKNKIYINDKELFEPFESVALDDRYHFGPLKLDGDEFFFLGDNRPNSKDSRIFGAIPAKLIRYKIKE